MLKEQTVSKCGGHSTGARVSAPPTHPGGRWAPAPCKQALPDWDTTVSHSLGGVCKGQRGYGACHVKGHVMHIWTVARGKLAEVLGLSGDPVQRRQPHRTLWASCTPCGSFPGTVADTLGSCSSCQRRSTGKYLTSRQQEDASASPADLVQLTRPCLRGQRL